MSSPIVTTSEPLEDLSDYEAISIAFTAASRLRPDLTEAATDPFRKDYDLFEDARPTEYPNRFDTSNWMTFRAWRNGELLGGAIVAWNASDFDMLEGRRDLAVMVDLRVKPDHRGNGIGSRLWRAAAEWATARGCTELRVETQDTNVAACRFYRRMGCRLLLWEVGAYGDLLDEAKLIWSLALKGPAGPMKGS